MYLLELNQGKAHPWRLLQHKDSILDHPDKATKKREHPSQINDQDKGCYIVCTLLLCWLRLFSENNLFYGKLTKAKRRGNSINTEYFKADSVIVDIQILKANQPISDLL